MRELDGNRQARNNENFARSIENVSKNAEDAERDLTHLAKALSYAAVEVDAFEGKLSDELASAFTDVVFESESLKGALQGLGEQMSMLAYNSVVESAADSAAGAITGGLNSLIGAAVQGSAGLPQLGFGGRPAGMAEIGAAQAFAPVPQSTPAQVVMNITTPDLPSFNRNQNQIAASLSRALGRANRVR